MKLLWALLLAAAAIGYIDAAATSRIIGGETTSITNYPMAVQVEFRNVFLWWSQTCAGVVLTKNCVLSVAQCFTGAFLFMDQRRIRAGTTVRNSGGFTYGIRKAINHPTFKTNKYEGDITILHLESPLNFGMGIAPAILPNQGFEMFDGAPVTLVGWGTMRVGGGGDHSQQIRHVEVNTINRDMCRNRYYNWRNRPSDVSENMICSGLLDVSERGTCDGDAGGPVLFNKDIVVGMISWQYTCANAYYPLVNTKISSYINWIRENSDL